MHPLLRAFLAALWLGGSLLWMDADRLPRDGDEEGHVGAAELMAEHLRAGAPAAFLDAAWRGDLGDYPPLFPALVGAGWWAAAAIEGREAAAPTALGDPGRLPVRGGVLLSLLGAALAMGWAADALTQPGQGRRAPPVRAGLAGTVAFGATLLLPMANGLSRHFMPEGALVGATALAVALALQLSRGDREGHAVLLGAVAGAGLLLKQSFALALLPPLLLLARGVGPRLVFASVAALLLAGPWYALHAAEQRAYVAATAAGALEPPLAALVGFYPLVLAWEGLGPPLALLAVVAAT